MAANQPDDGTLADLYRTHHARMVALAVHIVGDPAAAEDCVQEAFVRLADELDSVRSPGGWLRVAVTRRALNEVRRRGRERAAVERGVRAEREPAPDLVDPVDARLAAAVARLSPNQRAAVVLCWGDGLSAAEAAAAIGCSAATVRVHLHRARRSLAAALDPMTQEDA